MAKWTVELIEYNLQYHLRTTIKAQALTNFLAELPNPKLKGSEVMEGALPIWQVFVDGLVGAKGSRVGILLVSPSREETRVTV